MTPARRAALRREGKRHSDEAYIDWRQWAGPSAPVMWGEILALLAASAPKYRVMRYVGSERGHTPFAVVVDTARILVLTDDEQDAREQARAFEEKGHGADHGLWQPGEWAEVVEQKEGR